MLNYTVELPERRIRLAEHLAKSSSSRHQSLYDHLGKIGVACLLHKAGVAFDPHFLKYGHERSCDIAVGDYHLEVRTWPRDQWKQAGRSIEANQYHHIAENVDMIVWCIWDERDHIIRIMGCSTTRSVTRNSEACTKTIERLPVEFYQLEEWHVQPPHVLADAVGVLSGPEYLSARAHKALSNATSLRVLGVENGIAKVSWESDNLTCTSYLPCDAANGGQYVLTGESWNTFVENVQIDAQLRIDFSDDLKYIHLQTEKTTASIPAVQGY